MAACARCSHVGDVLAGTAALGRRFLTKGGLDMESASWRRCSSRSFSLLLPLAAALSSSDVLLTTTTIPESIDRAAPSGIFTPSE